MVRALLLTLALALLAAPASLAGAAGFRTPSGNIGCQASGSAIRCDIGQTSNGRPKRPRSCHQDYGFAYSITRGGDRGRRLCAGDTANDPRLPRLAYGRTFRSGGIACTSAPSGLTCTNHLGHGFFLSRARQRVF